jgi:two-component system chemotaxis response regulator CheY
MQDLLSPRSAQPPVNASLTNEQVELEFGEHFVRGAELGQVMKNVVVVEDSAIMREISVRILKELGVEAREATESAFAVEMCREKKPDAVLLDWDLPQFGALDFLRGVGALPSEQRPLIILVATENDHQQFALARAAGAAHHILKPFDAPTLKAKLAEIGVIAAESPGAARAVS